MATLPYIIGFDVKPISISAIGIVTYTDGTTTGGTPSTLSQIIPNQLECEAYGYTYDRALGTCSAFTYNTNLNTNIGNISNTVNGGQNTTETGTNNNLILGESNTIRSLSRNNIVVGTSNQITNEIHNTSVLGTLGESTAINSIVLGGNASVDALGERQNITVMYGTETTNNSTVDSYLNHTTGSYFQIPENTIVTFQTETVAVRTGGAGGGSVGDFKAMIEVGAAINKSGVLSIDSSRTIIANVGTTSGWLSTVGVSGTNFLQQVKGANNREIMWATTIRFTQIKTGVAL
jgi:hypothetical protein